MYYFEPADPSLQKFVSYIYLLEEKDPAAIRRKVIFPNTGSALTIFWDIEFVEVAQQRFSATEKSGSNGILLHMNRIDPVEIIESGRQNALVVVFRPLGINYFLRTTLQELQGEQNPTLINFHADNNHFQELVPAVKNAGDLIQKKQIVESFLKRNFQDPSIPSLEKMMEALSEVENDDNLTVIGKRYGISVKTMGRLFQKHICITPVEFRSITRFRASVKKKLDEPVASLNEIAAESQYSDLPYMFRVYKKFTGQPAKAFFDALTTGADGKYVYHEYY